MFILGLNIGHDASATVLCDGKVISHVLRERHSKIRHHLGIDRLTIEAAIKEAGIAAGDIKSCAVTATQQMPGLIDDPGYLRFSEHPKPNKFVNKKYRIIDNPWWKTAHEQIIVERWSNSQDPQKNGERYLRQWEKDRGLPFDIHNDWEMLGILSPLFGPNDWLKPYRIADTEMAMGKYYDQVNSFFSYQAFHFPIDLWLDNIHIPSWFINHHMAHASSSFYSSPFNESLIFTQDGGTHSDSGFVFLGRNSKITGIGPHYIECGQFYDHVAARLGLGTLGGAGKLMGLAPYGKGLLDGRIPTGTRVDWENWQPDISKAQSVNIYNALFDHLVEEAKSSGLDVSKLGQAGYVLEGAAPEIAHAVQVCLEETLNTSLSAILAMLKQKNIGSVAKNLCLSGGVALNCPANSKLYCSGLFENIHIEPHCEDGGLSVGAAHYTYWQLENAKTHAKPNTPLTSNYAMMGIPNTQGKEAVFRRYEEKVNFHMLDDWTLEAARAIANDKIIAVQFGKYETGPRALGHRSILANPAYAENWERVNIAKGREKWRPFAPAILAEALPEWFEDGPLLSPFMLFTHRIRNEKAGALPAITHVDGTSRVQTVTSSDAPLYQILTHLSAMGMPPIVMNTSFNGPGKPIVEDIEDAIVMLLSTGIDVVFIDGMRVTKK